MITQKNMSILLCALIAASGLTACGENNANQNNLAEAGTVAGESDFMQTENSADKELSIVCTIFPEYDWVKQILGDLAEQAEITCLLDSGVDLHSYQPTALDMAKIAECDLFVYVGGESDEWIEDALAEAVNPDMQVINLMDVMGDAAKEEEVKEGMEHDHDHDHDDDEHEHSHEKKAVSEDRTLSDYEGEWQSVYPFMSEKFKEETASYMAKAEGFDSEDEAWDFFYKGNETDTRYVNIKGDTIEFIKEDGTKTSGTYEYDGFYSDCWGETSIRYQFKNTDSASDAPKYVQFDDHLNFPHKAEHFHIYCGDDAEKMLDIMYNWPTYYPAEIESEDDMIHEFLKHYITDEDEDEHEHDHDHKHEEGEIEYDEHIWLSLKNAKTVCTEIADMLSILDSANAADYKTNLDAYTAQLDDLDGEFKALTDGAKQKTLVFGDRFPFRYFVDDYGLDYYAAFVGCSAETEASFETIVFLAGKMDDLGCGTIFTIENSDQKIAQTIIDNTKAKNQKIAELNSLQSVTKDEISSGVTYLSMMQDNYNTLKGALQ